MFWRDILHPSKELFFGSRYKESGNKERVQSTELECLLEIWRLKCLQAKLETKLHPISASQCSGKAWAEADENKTVEAASRLGESPDSPASRGCTQNQQEPGRYSNVVQSGHKGSRYVVLENCFPSERAVIFHL